MLQYVSGNEDNSTFITIVQDPKTNNLIIGLHQY